MNETSVDASRIGESFVDSSVEVRCRAINKCRCLSGLVLRSTGVLKAGAEL